MRACPAARLSLTTRSASVIAVFQSGEVVDPKVMRSVAPSLDQEALRVVKSSPRWTPGKHEGKAVDVMFNFPFNFVAQNSASGETKVLTPSETKSALESQPSETIDGEVFYVVEDMPQFPGGISGLKTYIYSTS